MDDADHPHPGRKNAARMLRRASTEAERSAANQATPIFLAHGRNDAVVPLARAHAAREELLRLGYTVQWQDYAMGHEVNPDEIEALQAWLLRVLG